MAYLLADLPPPSREFPAGQEDARAADRAVLEWYVISTANHVVKKMSSFSCTAALSGQAAGRTHVVWNGVRGCHDATASPLDNLYCAA